MSERARKPRAPSSVVTGGRLNRFTYAPAPVGDLVRLVAYGAQYHTRQYQTGQHQTGQYLTGDSRRLASSHDLSLALFVPTWTPTLDRELAVFGWTAEPLGGGYYVVRAQPYVLHVVVLAEVCRAEHDELLALHAGGTITGEAAYWAFQHSRGRREGFPMEKLEGYDAMMEEIMAKMPLSLRLSGLKPEERLSGLKPEERLSGLKPEERLTDLRPEEQILALSDEVLAGLSPSYVETLPAPVRDEIARRLTRH